jgi:hypothetical protein
MCVGSYAGFPRLSSRFPGFGTISRFLKTWTTPVQTICGSASADGSSHHTKSLGCRTIAGAL